MQAGPQTRHAARPVEEYYYLVGMGIRQGKVFPGGGGQQWEKK